MAEGIRQEAFAALHHVEQERIQGQTQDRAIAEAAINQVRSEAHGVINEALGARHRERQERSQMAKAEQKARRKIQEEENRRRNEQREEPVTPRAKAKAKSGPSPKRPSPMASPKRPSPKASPMKLEPVPIFPDGGEKASGSTDNPESAHEPKGRRGRPANTQPTNQVPPVKKKQPPNRKSQT